MTSDDKKRLTDGLKQAIQAEIDGYHFYMMAARSTSDDKGRGLQLVLVGGAAARSGPTWSHLDLQLDGGRQRVVAAPWL